MLTRAPHPSILAVAVLTAVALDAESVLTLQPPTPDSTGRRIPTTLAQVVVSDSARRRSSYTVRRTASATRTDVLLRDVPQSATVIRRALIADQAMQGMADVVRDVPGITMGQGERHRDAPTIRGQSTTADFFIDGIRDDAQEYRDVYNVDRVEAPVRPECDDIRPRRRRRRDQPRHEGCAVAADAQPLTHWRQLRAAAHHTRRGPGPLGARRHMPRCALRKPGRLPPPVGRRAHRDQPDGITAARRHDGTARPRVLQ